MKVKKIEQTEVTQLDIDNYKKLTAGLKKSMITANDVDIDKRIVTIRLREDDDIILVNPKITKTEHPIAYAEYDSVKSSKVRKTVRFASIEVDTDNIGKVSFSSENESWKTMEELTSDIGLIECVSAQRVIDAIDGIDITDKSRQFSTTIVSTDEKVGRNDYVMLSNDSGDMVRVKYKKADSYLQNGYKLL